MKTFEIRVCEYQENPREEFLQIGEIVYESSRYVLGDRLISPTEFLWELFEMCDLEYQDYDTLFVPKTFSRIPGYTFGDFVYDLEQGDKICCHEAWHRIEETGKIIILPVYGYDHGGIVLNTMGFSCPWDSGQCGFVWCKTAKVKEMFGWKLATKHRRTKVEDIMRREVEEFSAYLSGDVYVIAVFNHGKEVETLGPFYGHNVAEDYVKGLEDVD